LAAGEYLSIISESGSGASFSYTAAANVNVMFTNFAGNSWASIMFNTWDIGVQGVYEWAAETNVNAGKPAKLLLLENQTINGAVDNNYGILLSGVQI